MITEVRQAVIDELAGWRAQLAADLGEVGEPGVLLCQLDARLAELREWTGGSCQAPGVAGERPFQVTLPWGMKVSLRVDGDRPWLEIVDEDDGSGASTALTPAALRLLAEHAARLAGRAVVELPGPSERRPDDCTLWWTPGKMADRPAFHVGAEAESGVTNVWVQPHGRPWEGIKGSAGIVRDVALAMLAACAEAEHLAAEQHETAAEVLAERIRDAADRGPE